jgi:murein DD-endopeptidase MepM/ murein hydrolase activator NlpD
MGGGKANRWSAMLLVAVIALMGASWGSALVASAEISPSRTGKPTPTGTPTPSESPSPTESPSPSGGPSPTDPPTTSADPTGAPSTTPQADPSPSVSASPLPPLGGSSGPTVRILTAGHDGQLLRAEGRRHRHRNWKGWAPDPRWGTYGTAKLDRAAAKLRTKGWSEARIATRIYPPFIVEGPATWSDSWGAPRWTGGYHPHHGQDVLCRYGAPVLAVDRGEIVFGTDRLGGRVAYLELPNGAFWYYAHLKGYARDLASHDRVRPGRAIGYCGASGDATVPHVHFAYFDPSRTAVDPMPALVAWLEAAERRLGHDGIRRQALPDPVSLLRPIHPLLDRGTEEPGMIVVPVASEVGAIPPKARALGVAAVLCLAGATLATERRRRSSRGEGSGAADTSQTRVASSR